VRQHAPREFRRYQRINSGSLAMLAAIRRAPLHAVDSSSQ
jgi:hypothetical protein